MRLAVSASVAITILACGGDDGGPKSPIAPYTLTSIGSAKLPTVMYQEEGYSLEVTAGTIELVAPDRYTMTLTTLETVDGNKSTYVDSESGTWLLGANGALTMTATGGEAFTAAWNRSTLTVTRSDLTFTYEMNR